MPCPRISPPHLHSQLPSHSSLPSLPRTCGHLYFWAVPEKGGGAILLRMCRDPCFHNRKCQHLNQLHVLLIHQACHLIPWPELACQTQTTAEDNTKAQALTNERVGISLQLPWLCLHILETGGFCNLRMRRESLMCLWPKIGGLKSQSPAIPLRKPAAPEVTLTSNEVQGLLASCPHTALQGCSREGNRQCRNTLWLLDDRWINWLALCEQSNRNQGLVGSWQKMSRKAWNWATSTHLRRWLRPSQQREWQWCYRRGCLIFC